MFQWLIKRFWRFLARFAKPRDVDQTKVHFYALLTKPGEMNRNGDIFPVGVIGMAPGAAMKPLRILHDEDGEPAIPAIQWDEATKAVAEREANPVPDQPRDHVTNLNTQSRVAVITLLRHTKTQELSGVVWERKQPNELQVGEIFIAYAVWPLVCSAVPTGNQLSGWDVTYRQVGHRRGSVPWDTSVGLSLIELYAATEMVWTRSQAKYQKCGVVNLEEIRKYVAQHS